MRIASARPSGVAGNGQSELFLALSGEQPLARAEAIRIDGRAAGRLGPSARRRLGLAAIPEERNGHGAVPGMSLVENALLSARRRMALIRAGFVQATKARDFTGKVIEEFSVKTPGTDAAASSLSGGNLQKYVVGREILQNPDVLIVSQPTWGVDAGAAVTIHQSLMNLAATGAAIVVISQDLDELLTLTDRLAVINVGVLSDALPTADASIEEIGLLMGGLHGLESGPPKNGGAVDAA